MALYQIEVQLNHRKPKKINAYTAEIYNFIEFLNFKHDGWEEFVLSSDKGRLCLRFLKYKDKLQKVSKNRDLMHLTIFLDRNYAGWNRFVVSKTAFEELKYDQCEANMLVRRKTGNNREYLFIEDTNLNKDGSKELVCNQEGEAMVLNPKKYKRSTFILLMQSADQEQVNEVLND